MQDYKIQLDALIMMELAHQHGSAFLLLNPAKNQLESPLSYVRHSAAFATVYLLRGSPHAPQDEPMETAGPLQTN